MRQCLFVWYVILSLSSSFVWAFDNDKQVNFKTSYYIDSTHLLSAEELILQHKHPFTAIAKPSDFNLGHHDFTVWVKITLEEVKQGKDYLLTIENAHLDTVVFYRYHKGIAQSISTGDRQPFFTREHEYNMFVFTLPDSCDYFLLKTTTQGSLSMPMTIKGINEYLVDSSTDVMMLALFLGVVTLAILLNLLLFVRMHEKVYLFYVLCLMGNLILNAVDSGILFEFLWPNQPWINQYVTLFYAFSVTGLFFSQNILSLRTHAPVLNKIYYVFFAYVVLMVGINLAGYYHISIKYIVYYFYASSFLFLFSGLYIYFAKKYQPAFYYTIAWAAYSVSGMIYMLASEGVISYTFFTKNALKIGNILEVIFLFLAVIDKIYELRAAKQKSDREALRLIQENREILMARNNALEKFASFTAHNIRGPVSSIMGLANLFTMVKGDINETDKLVDYIKQSTLQLDDVVRDMITLLTLNNTEIVVREEVSLLRSYQESKDKFLLSVKDPSIVFDEKHIAGRVYGDEQVIRYIIDHLFENAYKFKELRRPLTIQVWTEEEEHYCHLYFSDNGIGFDYDRYANDVFGLYKRFHVNAVGKGLGLYFIKEYMHKIKGKVAMQSKVGEGTRVKLSFEKVIEPL